MKPAHSIAASDVNLRDAPEPMTTPPNSPTPAPEWAIEAAKAIEADHQFGRMEPQRIKERAAIIQKHAPPAPTGDSVRLDLESAIRLKDLIATERNKAETESQADRDALVHMVERCEALQAKLDATEADLKRLYELGASRQGHFPAIVEENMVLRAKLESAEAAAMDSRGELVIAWDSSDRDTTVLISRANEKGRTIIYRGQGRDGFWRESHDAARAATPGKVTEREGK